MKQLKYLLSLFLLFQLQSLSSQTLAKEKMENLSFMVGEWIGTSSQYDAGQLTQEVPAFERISYELNNSTLIIELNSKLLQLHTVIHFSEKDDTYYYYAFSKNGGGKLPATFADGRLVVQATESRRYIFEKTKENGFREVGEKLKDGKWVKYFEDVFVNTDQN